MAPPDPVYTREDEYETQFYGFCQKDIIEHFKFEMQDQTMLTLKGLKRNLLESLKTDEGKEAVERLSNAVIENWPETSRAPMEVLVEQISSFFALPPHILLNEDKLQRKQYSPEDEIKEKSEIDKLKSRFRRAQFLKKCYEEELEKAKELEKCADICQKTLAQLENPQTLAKANQAKELQKAVQNLLGAEVEEANLKLSDPLSCGEGNEPLLDGILDQYG